VVTRRSTTRRASTKKAGDVIEVDFEGYEPPRSEYMGPEPRKGVYRFKATDVKRHLTDNGNESIRWIFECQDGAYAGWAGFMYTGLPGSENFFRTQHTVRALQGGAEKAVKLDLEDPTLFLKKAKVVLGRVVMEEYAGDMRAKLRTVTPDDPSIKSTVPIIDEDIDDEYEEVEDEDDEYDDEEEDGEDTEEEGDEEDDEDDEDLDDDEEDDDEEDDDEGEEEPEPEPVKPARRRAKPAPAKAAPAPRRAAKAAPAKAAPAKRTRRAR